MAIGMGRRKNKRSILSFIIWEGVASREDLKRFTIASKRSSSVVNLKSALIELKKSASRWTRMRRHNSLIQWRKMGHFWYKKNWWISLNTSGRNPPMKSDQISSKHFFLIAPSSPWVWRTAIRADSFLAVSEMILVVFFIQHILVAVERFLVEFLTINKKVCNWAHVKSSRLNGETRCAVSSQNFRLVVFQVFFIFQFVAVRSFTAYSSLLQPTLCVNTLHTSHFLTDSHAHAWLKSCLSCAHHLSWVISMRSCVCSDSLRLFHFLLSADHLLSYHLVFIFCPSISCSTNVVGKSFVHSVANEDFGTLAEHDPFTPLSSYDSVPADCIAKVASTKSGNIFQNSHKLCRKNLCKNNMIKKRSNKQASRTRSSDRKIRSKSTSECKECHESSTWRSRTNDQRTLSKLIPGRSLWSLIHRKLMCSAQVAGLPLLRGHLSQQESLIHRGRAVCKKERDAVLSNCVTVWTSWRWSGGFLSFYCASLLVYIFRITERGLRFFWRNLRLSICPWGDVVLSKRVEVPIICF